MNERFEHGPGFQEEDSRCTLQNYSLKAEMSWVCTAACNRAANSPATCEMHKWVKVQWALLYCSIQLQNKADR